MPVKLDSNGPDLFPLASNSNLSFSGDESNELVNDDNSNASDSGHNCSEEKRRRSSKDCNKENCSDNEVQNVNSNVKDDSSLDSVSNTNQIKDKKPLLAGPPPLANSHLPGVNRCLLYNGSRFVGHQKSKGSCYDVEVILQHVDKPNSYLCGYLKITGKFRNSFSNNTCKNS